MFIPSSGPVRRDGEIRGCTLDVTPLLCNQIKHTCRVIRLIWETRYIFTLKVAISLNYLEERSSINAFREYTVHVQPDIGPNFRVLTGRVDPQDPKTGPIGSGWLQKRVQIQVRSYDVLINLIWTWPEPFLCRVGLSGSKFRSNSGRVGQAHLAALD